MDLNSVLITGADGFSGSKLKMHYPNQKLIVLVFQKKKENNKIIKWDLIKNNNKKSTLRLIG